MATTSDPFSHDEAEQYRHVRQFGEIYYPFGDLYQFLRRHLLSNADEVARDVLQYDRPDHAVVVGVDERACGVFLFHRDEHYLVRVGLTESGLNDRGGPIRRDFGAYESLSRWIDEQEWDDRWLHPRFRPSYR